MHLLLELKKQEKLYNCFLNKEKRLNLIPKLVSNIQIVIDKGNVSAQRLGIKDVLFSLPESDLEFLEDLKNNISCKELQEKHEMNEEDFWEIMITLWERKAIIFQDEI